MGKCHIFLLFSLRFLWLVVRLLVICISSSMVYLFMFLTFFLLSCWIFDLYTVDISPLLATYVADNFC